MGPESESKYTVYFDGKPIGPGLIQEIKLTEEMPEPDNVLSFQLPPMAFYLKTPKRWRCRSRKRFIKLMMSEGISRNGAVWLANFIRKLMP